MVREGGGPPWFFAFDLDGTLTREELLPRLASLLGREKAMEELTRRTLAGELPFEASFRMRFGMLHAIPLAAIRECVASVPLDAAAAGFIMRHKERCALVTGNLDLWIAPLAERLGCRVFCSRAADGGRRIASILRKDAAVRAVRQEGFRVAAIGDSANDASMLREADAAFAFSAAHEPAAALLPLAHALFRSGVDLCHTLEALDKGDWTPGERGVTRNTADA